MSYLLVEVYWRRSIGGDLLVGPLVVIGLMLVSGILPAGADIAALTSGVKRR
jgi:hypothetical protein